MVQQMVQQEYIVDDIGRDYGDIYYKPGKT